MKLKILTIFAIILMTVWTTHAAMQYVLPPEVPIVLPMPEIAIAEPAFTHAQETWISALEWCESQARPAAINKIDRDGTPSYYSFQFKPDTFKGYGELYGVIPKRQTHDQIMSLMKDTDLQRSVVKGMIKDKKTRWEDQFPVCIKKLGRPPTY